MGESKQEVKKWRNILLSVSSPFKYEPCHEKKVRIDYVLTDSESAQSGPSFFYLQYLIILQADRQQKSWSDLTDVH